VDIRPISTDIFFIIVKSIAKIIKQQNGCKFVVSNFINKALLTLARIAPKQKQTKQKNFTKKRVPRLKTSIAINSSQSRII